MDRNFTKQQNCLILILTSWIQQAGWYELLNSFLFIFSSENLDLQSYQAIASSIYWLDFLKPRRYRCTCISVASFSFTCKFAWYSWQNNTLHHYCAVWLATVVLRLACCFVSDNLSSLTCFMTLSTLVGWIYYRTLQSNMKG
jgi:hypothetical protein